MVDEKQNHATVPLPPFGLTLFQVASAAASSHLAGAALYEKAARDPAFDRAAFGEKAMGVWQQKYADSKIRKALDLTIWATEIAGIEMPAVHADPHITVPVPPGGMFDMALEAASWFARNALQSGRGLDGTWTGTETPDVRRFRDIAAELQGWASLVMEPDDVGPSDLPFPEKGTETC